MYWKLSEESNELDDYISSNKNLFKDIYASSNRRSKITSFVKPMVINIVRHRESITDDDFSTYHIKKAIKAS